MSRDAGLRFWNKECCIGCIAQRLRDKLINCGYCNDDDSGEDARRKVDEHIANLFGFSCIEELDQSTAADEDNALIPPLASKIVALTNSPHTLTLFKVMQVRHLNAEG